MAAKKHKAPPGCDYDPIAGDDPNISYGTARSGSGKTKRTLADVIVKRWQEFTGKQAVHEATGLTFDELAQSKNLSAIEKGVANG